MAPPPGHPARTGTQHPAPRGRPDEPGALAGIEAAARTLRLPTIRERIADMLGAAQREQASYARFLAEALLAECDDRDERRQVRRVRDGAFPRAKRVEDFDFAANPAVNPATIASLATAGWVFRGPAPSRATQPHNARRPRRPPQGGAKTSRHPGATAG